MAMGVMLSRPQVSGRVPTLPARLKGETKDATANSARTGN
jgi:hypothetical protein